MPTAAINFAMLHCFRQDAIPKKVESYSWVADGHTPNNVGTAPLSRTITTFVTSHSRSYLFCRRESRTRYWSAKIWRRHHHWGGLWCGCWSEPRKEVNVFTTLVNLLHGHGTPSTFVLLTSLGILCVFVVEKPDEITGQSSGVISRGWPEANEQVVQWTGRPDSWAAVSRLLHHRLIN